MHWLVLVTFIWAFSFSLIGVYLAGEVDGYIAVFSRMLLATLVFLPFLRTRRIQWHSAYKLMAIGSIQIGVMYLFFYHSFLFLTVPEVLLFTIFTPIYVTLINDLVFERRMTYSWLWGAILSVIGAGIIRYDNISDEYITGFLLVQMANLCFATGQVTYKHLPLGDRKNQLNHFVFFFIGATILSGIAALIFADWNKLPETPTEIGVILWLGIIASGVGYFLWNFGAKLVNPGQLATMNNALIPAGLLVNILIWSKPLDWPPFLIGGSLIVLSVLLVGRKKNARV